MRPTILRMPLAAALFVAVAGAVALRGTGARQNPYPPQYQALAGSPSRDLAPAWTTTVPGVVHSAAVAPDGSCVAVVVEQPLPGRIALFDRNGQRAWDFAPDQVVTFPVAVAPGCAFVAYEASRGVDPRAPTPKGAVGLQRRGGPPVAVSVDGRPNSIAISQAGDLIAIGTDGRTNVFLASPDGRIVRALQRFSATAPQVSFSADDGFIVISGWYGVGVITRTGETVWGPWPTGGVQSKRTDWRRIDASRDLQWFAAEQGPMHGPDGGSFALLSRAGEIVWQGPPVWGAAARMSPDGSYFVATGSQRRPGTDIDSGAPSRVVVMDTTGRLLASKDMPRPVLEAITPDGRFILMREVDPSARMWMVGRDRTLAPAWRLGLADAYCVHAESGLVVAWSGGRISVYVAPR